MPTLDELNATRLAWLALGKPRSEVPQPAAVPAPQLVIWGDLDAMQLAPVHLAWEVAISNVDANGFGPIGRYYIDARDEYGFSPEAIGPLQDYIQRNLESTRRAVRAGVRLAMGSDAVFTMFGQNTRELGWFVKAGMTPTQALETATAVPAKLLGIDDRLGRLAPGYIADLVAVEGDPLTNIEALFTGVRWVMKDGRIVVDKTH